MACCRGSRRIDRVSFSDGPCRALYRADSIFHGARPRFFHYDAWGAMKIFQPFHSFYRLRAVALC